MEARAIFALKDDIIPIFAWTGVAGTNDTVDFYGSAGSAWDGKSSSDILGNSIGTIWVVVVDIHANDVFFAVFYGDVARFVSGGGGITSYDEIFLFLWIIWIDDRVEDDFVA